MKRLLALVAVAGIATALYATTAGGSGQAVTPAQFNALKKQVNALVKATNALGTFTVNCVAGSALPVTRYGDYLAADSNGHVFFTTGLDATAQGGTPNAWFVAANPDPNCINLINSASVRKLLSIKPITSRTAPSLKTVSHR